MPSDDPGGYKERNGRKESTHRAIANSCGWRRSRGQKKRPEACKTRWGWGWGGGDPRPSGRPRQRYRRKAWTASYRKSGISTRHGGLASWGRRADNPCATKAPPTPSHIKRRGHRVGQMSDCSDCNDFVRKSKLFLKNNVCAVCLCQQKIVKLMNRLMPEFFFVICLSAQKLSTEQSLKYQHGQKLFGSRACQTVNKKALHRDY